LKLSFVLSGEKRVFMSIEEIKMMNLVYIVCLFLLFDHS
jgi:hypothetical protein